jgi:hypothetical protein
MRIKQLLTKAMVSWKKYLGSLDTHLRKREVEYDKLKRRSEIASFISSQLLHTQESHVLHFQVKVEIAI